MPSQEDIDKKLAEYFSRLDPLAAGILAEIEAVKSECTKWDELSQKQRDDLIDNHFIPHDVKSTYKNKKSVLGTDKRNFKIKKGTVQLILQFTTCSVLLFIWIKLYFQS